MSPFSPEDLEASAEQDQHALFRSDTHKTSKFWEQGFTFSASIISPRDSSCVLKKCLIQWTNEMNNFANSSNSCNLRDLCGTMLRTYVWLSFLGEGFAANNYRSLDDIFNRLLIDMSRQENHQKDSMECKIDYSLGVTDFDLYCFTQDLLVRYNQQDAKTMSGDLKALCMSGKILDLALVSTVVEVLLVVPQVLECAFLRQVILSSDLKCFDWEKELKCNKISSAAASLLCRSYGEKLLNQALEIILNKFDLSITNVNGLSASSKIDVTWKIQSFGIGANLEEGAINCGISVHPLSPLMQSERAAYQLLKTLTATKKRALIVIADTLQRFNIAAFEKKFTGRVDKARRAAKKRGQPFFDALLSARAEVADEFGSDILHQVKIIGWDELICSEGYQKQLDACNRYYSNVISFRDRVDNIAAGFVLKRGRDATNKGKLDLAVQYILEEIPHILGGVIMQEMETCEKRIHYNQVLYPTNLSEASDDSLSSELFRFVCHELRSVKEFQNLFDQLRELNGGDIGMPWWHVIPLCL